MYRELKPEEVVFNICFDEIRECADKNYFPEYDKVCECIKESFEIQDSEYNIFLIDDFCSEKLEYIKEVVQSCLKEKSSPRDILYVIKKNQDVPSILFTPTGLGNILKNEMLNLKENYLDCAYEFYNTVKCKEKEEIVAELSKSKNLLLTRLTDLSSKEDFEIKPSSTGFSFIPLKDGAAITEKEYDSLSEEEKNKILNKIGILKKETNLIIDELKDLEAKEIENLKVVYESYINKYLEDIKIRLNDQFKSSQETLKYVLDVCEGIEEELVDRYSMSYEDDEEKINECINKYDVNVIVDNSNNDHPVVYYEEDPNITNLYGSIEYETKNGNYFTDISLIRAGSILKANEGCLIVRANDLFNNNSAYYYLKKAILTKKIDLNYNKSYLDLLSINALKPESVKIDERIIVIGSYEAYSILYNYDDDFKKLFRIKAEYNPIVEIDEISKRSFLCKLKYINNFSFEAKQKIAKYMSRKAEDRNKILLDGDEINKIVTLSENNRRKHHHESIEKEDVYEAIYKKDIYEEEVLRSYKEKKMLIQTEGRKVGQVNGLSVIDTGFMCFGKPVRITCTNQKGQGNIIDIQKESDLSGSIHKKSINILKGYLNNSFGGYNVLPVDFYLSFEQVYGKIEGDSASVAEIISILSVLSKIPVKQNIAVTGSINQFGEIQPIGGVNEKIEGFFNICNTLGSTKDRGVVIPYLNKDDIVLNEEVENAINNRSFHIYTINDIKDAVEILMSDEKMHKEEIFKIIQKEIKKYTSKGR